MKKFISLLICLITVCLVFTSCEKAETPTLVIENHTVSATAKPINNEAKFNVTAQQDGMYSFTLEKNNTIDWDFSFYILNENGKKVTGDMTIHSTEWIKRNVFLQKGNYTLVVFGDEVNKKINLYIDVVNYYKNSEAVLTQKGEITAPAILAFDALNTQEKEVKFTLDGSKSRLSFTAFGTGSYYDYCQQFTAKIINEKGEVVFYTPDESSDEYVYEDNYVVDVTGIKGDFTALVSSNDNCTVSIDIG